ncbi:MAG TPA: EamA family transporter [Acidimicrobiales bacterium]|nr:EamA family transporter [Acidimicrobiales bacterium]
MTDPSLTGRRRAGAGAGFMLLGATLIQWSAALVTGVFGVLSPSATSAWRFLLGAMVLLALTRPNVSRWSKREWTGALALGISAAFMNQCFYQAIARIPLGGAVAIEFLGPFFVAALGKRSVRHFVFVALAGAGVIALARPGSGLNATGVLFAAGSGLGWAAYVFASHRVGDVTSGFGGLAVSMSIAALVTLPLSLGSLSVVREHPNTLARLLIVATMSIVFGFGAELQGLRRVRPAIAAVLLATDPAVAFFIGWLLLGQHVHVFDYVGVSCVMLASIGVTHDTVVGAGELAQ